ncbi:MAG: phage tail tape measure protein, partial [Bacillaceae bacterium G1]
MADNIEVGNLNVKISLDDSGINKSMAELNRTMRVLQSEFQAASAKLGDAGKNIEGLRLRSDSLTKQIEIQRQRVAKLTEEHAKAAEEKGKDARETQNLEVRLNRAQAQLAQLETELKQVNSEITKQTSGWYQFGQRLEQTGERLKRVGDGMSDVGRSLSATITAPLAAVGVLSAKAAIDFESAFAGVRKTVDATEEEFAQLEKGIREMAKEIPAAATEIAKVAEAAGQLGIQKDAILGFTRTMIDLGVATNLTSDQAATALARLANITQMNQQEFDRLGSALVALGNNLATTEAEIVEMALRIAGAGAQIGLTEAQILAFAAALSSVGIEAEAGGTAISRVFITIFNAVQEGSKELQLFAQVAGMSVAEFSRLFREDAALATVTFIEGLDRMAKSGANVFSILEELGLSEIRVRDALLRAASAGDLFRSSIELASRAWEENTALTKEAEQRYKTTASQLQILKNRIVDIGITLGQAIIPVLLKALDALQPLLNLLAAMAQWFANLPSGIQTTAIAFAALIAAAGPLLILTGSLVSSFGTIVTALGKLSTWLGAAGGAAAVFGRAIAALTGPIGIAIAAISTLLAAVTAVYRFFRADSIPAVQGFGDAAQKASERSVGSFKKVQNELRNTTEVARVEAPKIG